MIPTYNQIIALHKKYARNEKLLQIFFQHCEIVADIALWCAENVSEKVDKQRLRAACLLHDIGSYMLTDESGDIDTDYYQLHGLLGAAILRDENIDNRVCEAVRTHQMLINTLTIVEKVQRTKPSSDDKPQSIEAELLCYADRFHSKQPIFNSEEFLQSFLKDLPRENTVYESMKKRFGLPDLKSLAAKYNQPIR